MPRSYTTAAKAYSVAYYAANREKILAAAAAYRIANPEKVKSASAAHYAANREKVKAASAAWKKANSDKARASDAASRGRNVENVRASRAAWAATNQHKINAKEARRRAAILQRTPAWADHEMIAGFYELAAILSLSGVRFEVDHEVPLQGKNVSGLHVHNNLAVITAAANRRKNNQFK